MPAAASWSLEMLTMKAGAHAKESTRRLGTRAGPTQSLPPAHRVFPLLLWLLCFLSGNAISRGRQERRGNWQNRSPCPFAGPLVKVPFEKLPRGLTEPQERWDFPHAGLVDRRQSSATGREPGEREQRGIESRNRLPLCGRFWTN